MAGQKALLRAGLTPTDAATVVEEVALRSDRLMDPGEMAYVAQYNEDDLERAKEWWDFANDKYANLLEAEAAHIPVGLK